MWKCVYFHWFHSLVKKIDKSWQRNRTVCICHSRRENMIVTSKSILRNAYILTHYHWQAVAHLNSTYHLQSHYFNFSENVQLKNHFELNSNCIFGWNGNKFDGVKIERRYWFFDVILYFFLSFRFLIFLGVFVYVCLCT